jgi:hypothetical protein
MWFRGFMYLYEIEIGKILQKWGGRGLRGRDDGSKVTNVQYKSNQN